MPRCPRSSSSSEIWDRSVINSSAWQRRELATRGVAFRIITDLSPIFHEAQLRRQADAPQVVALHDGRARTLAQRRKFGLVLERMVYPLGDGGGGKEIDQQPVLAVAHHLLHRRGARGDDEAAGGHGF